MRQAIDKCVDHMTSAFSLLEVERTKQFSIRLNTRKYLMNQVSQFCPRTFTCNNMKESIVAEEEEGEYKETNQDKHENIVENIKKYAEDINRNGEEEIDRVEDDFEIDMNVIDVDKEYEILRIDNKDGKEEQTEIMIE